MVPRVESTHEEPKAEVECHHHWVIESPKGPSSQGVCKYCGAEKEFLNYLEGFFWEDDISVLSGIAGVKETNSAQDSDNE